MDHRVIEIVYDIATIAGVTPGDAASPRLLRFRDRALAGLASCLGEDGLGHPIGAEIDAGELTLRALVQDFDAAEARLRNAADPVCAGYREVVRSWDTVSAA